MSTKPIAVKRLATPIFWLKASGVTICTLLFLQVCAIIVWISEDRTYITGSLLIRSMMIIATFTWVVLLASKVWDWLTETGVKETPLGDEEVIMFGCQQSEEPDSRPETFIAVVVVILLSSAGLLEPALAFFPLFVGFITFGAFAFLFFIEWSTRTKPTKSTLAT